MFYTKIAIKLLLTCLPASSLSPDNLPSQCPRGSTRHVHVSPMSESSQWLPMAIGQSPASLPWHTGQPSFDLALAHVSSHILHNLCLQTSHCFSQARNWTGSHVSLPLRAFAQNIPFAWHVLNPFVLANPDVTFPVALSLTGPRGIVLEHSILNFPWLRVWLP